MLLAGWTTANPTIYRAGLAMQTITPNWKRWKVTLAVGMITTMAALFPALMMRLLDFVALYGLLLMPMGCGNLRRLLAVAKAGPAAGLRGVEATPLQPPSSAGLAPYVGGLPAAKPRLERGDLLPGSSGLVHRRGPLRCAKPGTTASFHGSTGCRAD